MSRLFLDAVGVDEPTNHLDIGTQLGLLSLVRALGVTVLAALHDLNLAAIELLIAHEHRHLSVVAAVCLTIVPARTDLP